MAAFASWLRIVDARRSAAGIDMTVAFDPAVAIASPEVRAMVRRMVAEHGYDPDDPEVARAIDAAIAAALRDPLPPADAPTAPAVPE